MRWKEESEKFANSSSLTQNFRDDITEALVISKRLKLL